MKPAHIGCSGWSYKEWRGILYPEGLPTTKWLPRYAEEFSTVEVNNTFYRLASKPAVENWIEQTPDDFIFTLKVSRYLSHVKRLTAVKPYIKRYLDPLRPLYDAGRAGPLLWQFPENFRRNEENYERLSKALPQLDGQRHCLEFRHESWFDDEVYKRLREHNVALVIGDHPDRPFQSHEITADWTLIRFHHGSRGRKGNYSQAELQQWARRIGKWRKDTEVFAYFNNDWKGYAVKNASWLRDRLADSKP